MSQVEIKESELNRLLLAIPDNMPSSRLFSGNASPYLSGENSEDIYAGIDLTAKVGSVGEVGLYFNVPLGEILNTLSNSEQRLNIVKDMRENRWFASQKSMFSNNNFLWSIKIEGISRHYRDKVSLEDGLLRGYNIGLDLPPEVFNQQGEDFDTEVYVANNEYGIEKRLIVKGPGGNNVQRLVYRTNPSLKVGLRLQYPHNSFGDKATEDQQAQEQNFFGAVMQNWNTQYAS